MVKKYHVAEDIVVNKPGGGVMPGVRLQAPQPGSRPVPSNLWPTLDSLEAVLELGLSQLPIMTPNNLVSLLMVHHNTLIKLLEPHLKS